MVRCNLHKYQIKENIKMKNKRGMSAWMWILTLVIVIAIGVGAYFLLTGGNDGGAIVGAGSSSIPSPPALPN